MKFPGNITEDEKKEFTAVNLVAHNVLREQSDARQPCWLCMGEEARQEARQKAIEWYNANGHAIVPLVLDKVGLARFEAILAPAASGLLQGWVDAEATYKRLRVEEHNPQAFFCPS